MTSTFLKFAAAALFVGATAHAAAADKAPLPKAFNDIGVTMQSRVCGELMAGLALGGVQALKVQFPTGEAPEAMRKPVYDTGAQAVVLLSMSGSLKLEERLKAGEIAQGIEKMEPKVHVDTALFCQRRVEAWLRAGQVGKEVIAQAYAQSQQLLDKAFAMGPGDN